MTEQPKMEYKTTLNLPKTDFPMKADLPKREPLLLEKWQSQDIYNRILKSREGRETYILHDGPPYANGDIHIGHALNKILKDIVVKYKSMKGYLSPYVPGWDCHGLPVEHQLFKELKVSKSDVNQAEFRVKAHKYAMRYVAIQRDQFKRLGIFGDWENPYLTLDKVYEAQIIRSFGRLVKDGYIYKGLKPVNWCYVCETALAEAEVEYEDHASDSVYVKFKVISPQGGSQFFIIWTTTPWTLLANVEVAVHPGMEYAFVKVGAETWVMMKDLTAPSMEKFGIKEYEIIKTLRGRELEGAICRHPFIDRDSQVVMANYVSNVDGTGCVHTAPGHGQEDYATGQRYGLPTIMPVDEKGRFDKTTGEFAGLNVHKADKAVIEKLKGTGALVFSGQVSHSYPHCWRCKNPIIFRATPQWFMKIDHKDLRNRLLETIAKKVRWVPASGRERISSMVASRPDWCLSRQRLWGVPIVAFYCRGCGRELLDGAVIEHVAGLVEKDGVDIWFVKREEELLPKGTSCPGCGGTSFKKELDIIDVWFDSGVSHQAVLRKRAGLGYPADLYLEGSDQHRGWFQSSLITAMGIEGSSPFRAVLTHGFVVDGEGKKMSKSLGNVISPHDIIKANGADILRLWVASSDYSEDIRLSDQIVTRLSDAYRKIRNTYRFILGNLYDFDPSKDAVKLEEMTELDRWALSGLSRLLEVVEKSYEEFAFHNVFHSVYNFCVIQLSSFYLDILKDRLYISGTRSVERRSSQTALFEIMDTLNKVMAPILAFTSEEVYKSFYKDEAATVHAAMWPDRERLKKFFDQRLDERWSLLIKVRTDVLKMLELKRAEGVIGSSLEAKVLLYSRDASLRKLLKEYSYCLNFVLIVSQAEVADIEPEGAVRSAQIDLSIKVERADGTKCVRCWNYSKFVGRDDLHPALCERCVKILKGEGK